MYGERLLPHHGPSFVKVLEFSRHGGKARMAPSGVRLRFGDIFKVDGSVDLAQWVLSLPIVSVTPSIARQGGHSYCIKL